MVSSEDDTYNEVMVPEDELQLLVESETISNNNNGNEKEVSFKELVNVILVF